MKNYLIYLKTFLIGFLMGTCDVIPGISGGTIAFICGIYKKLITTLKNILSFEFIKNIIKIKQIKKNIIDYNLIFLLTLIIGIGSALIFVSKSILYLLNNFEIPTLSFFIGLIIASIIIILKKIKKYNIKNIIFITLGIICGISTIFLNTYNISNVSYLYIILGGFISISAMFLPGISGAFILYVMGLYEVVYGSLHNIIQKWDILLSFIIGAILGTIIISKIINFLFQKYKNQTLSFLSGLILGALIIPLNRINIISNIYSLHQILSIIFFIIIGIIIVIIIEKLSKEK